MRLQFVVMMDGLSGCQAEVIGLWAAAGFPPPAHKRPGWVCAQPLAEAPRHLERPPSVRGHAGDTVIPKRGWAGWCTGRNGVTPDTHCSWPHTCLHLGDPESTTVQTRAICDTGSKLSQKLPFNRESSPRRDPLRKLRNNACSARFPIPSPSQERPAWAAQSLCLLIRKPGRRLFLPSWTQDAALVTPGAWLVTPSGERSFPCARPQRT